MYKWEGLQKHDRSPSSPIGDSRLPNQASRGIQRLMESGNLHGSQRTPAHFPRGASGNPRCGREDSYFICGAATQCWFPLALSPPILHDNGDGRKVPNQVTCPSPQVLARKIYLWSSVSDHVWLPPPLLGKKLAHEIPHKSPSWRPSWRRHPARKMTALGWGACLHMTGIE